MSKCVTMYEENKPSTLINDVQEWRNFFRAILVRSAMPKIIIYLILLPYYYVRFVRSFVYILYYYERTNERTKVLNYYRWDFPADRFDESSWWHLPKKPTRLFSMARRTTERVASISPPPTKQTVLSEHDFKTSLTHEKFEQTEIALLRKKLSVVVSAFNTEIQKHENELKTVWYNDPAPHYNCWEHAVHSGHFSLTRRNVV